MRDRLVFVKTKSENRERCPDCHIGVQGNCIKNKSGIIFMDCEPMYHYKLEEEQPEKIQTEYEHNKERHDLICTNIKDHRNEADKLAVWLCNNKPEKWETCTKENTKVGDEVRCNTCADSSYEVEHLFNTLPLYKDNDVVLNDTINSFSAWLKDYEINTYKE